MDCLGNEWTDGLLILGNKWTIVDKWTSGEWDLGNTWVVYSEV